MPLEPTVTSGVRKRWKLALQGAPGTGKTTSAATFPAPLYWLSWDGNSPPGACEYPFYNLEWCEQQCHKHSITHCAETPGTINRRDLFRKFLRVNIPQFPVNSTVILDSWTALQVEFDSQTEPQAAVTKNATQTFFMQKLKYATDIMNLLHSVPGNLIVILHESPDRDNEGNLNGKVRPLMSGQFGDRFPLFFTDWYRQVVIEDKDPVSRIVRKDANGNPIVRYMWQVQPDHISGTRVSYPVSIKYIDANYQSLLKVSGTQTAS